MNFVNVAILNARQWQDLLQAVQEVSCGISRNEREVDFHVGVKTVRKRRGHDECTNVVVQREGF